MTPHPTEPSMPDEAARDREEKLADVFQSYLDRMNAGQEIDFAQIRSDHPALAEDLIDQLEVARQIRSEFGSGEPLGTLGDYTLRRQIGRGGMGVVYEAWQGSLDRQVALKVLPAGVAADDKAFHRFMREAKTAAKLRHGNVVGVYGMGVESDTPYYSMEFVEGETLAQMLARLKAAEGRGTEERTVLQNMTAILSRKSSTSGAMGGSDADAQPGPRGAVDVTDVDLRYCIQLADAFADAADGLQHAHSKGVIHRDIKPSNLILDRDGHLRILDFGLARLEGQESLTLSGDLMGTVLYMSPEQAMAKRIPLDHRTDIYSLGATLYEMITRRPPFGGKSHHDTLSHIVLRDPRPPRQLNPRAPRDLETIVLKCLRKAPEERYATAEALAQDLRRFVRGDPVEAAPQSPWEKGARRLWRRRRLLAAGAAVLLLAWVGLAAGTVMIARERDEAKRKTYLAHMSLAHNAYRAGNIARMERLLDAHRPRAGEEDHPGWEWYYLDQLRHKEALSFVGHTGQVFSVAWSPDAVWLASASADGTVRIWNPSTGEEVRKLGDGEHAVRAVGWTRDGGGTLLAAGDSRGLVSVWDVSAWRLISEVSPETPSEVMALAWSPRGKNLAFVCWDGTVEVWNVRDGERVKTLSVSGAPVSVAWSPDGRTLATGLSRRIGPAKTLQTGLVIFWDTGTWTETHRLEDDVYVSSIAWSHDDGSRFASVSLDGPVRIRDARTWSKPVSLEGHRGFVYCLEWSHDDEFLAIGSADGFVRIRQSPSYEESFALRGHSGKVLSMAWHPLGEPLLVTGSADKSVRLWEPLQPQEYLTVPGAKAAWSPDGRWLAAKHDMQDGITIFDAATYEPAKTLRLEGKLWVRFIAFSPDSRRVARVGSDGKLQVWDWEEGTLILDRIAHTADARSVAFSPEDGRFIATGGRDRTARVWESGTGKEVCTLPMPADVGSVAWSPDGRELAVKTIGQDVWVWDLARRETRLRLDMHPGLHNSGYDTDGGAAVAWSPDGSRLAAGSSEGAIVVYDALSGDEEQRLLGHTSTVRGVDWSPDGRRLATGSNDGSVRIWDPASGEELLVIEEGAGIVLVVAWQRPEGRRLLAAGNGSVKIWDAPGYEPAER